MAFVGAPSSYHVVDGKIQNGQLELNVVENCNLTCRSCSHLSPILPKRRVDAATVEHDLRLLSGHYHAEWLKLVGGEPLLHPDLVSIADAIRRSGVADRIYLVTNGVLLPRMGPDLWEAMDWIEVSLYPGRSLSEEQQAGCWSAAGRAGTGLSFRRRDEFRTSYSEVGTADVTLSRAIYRTCAVAHQWKCHSVADGRFFKCPHSYVPA
jgi:organic radical activating enzyme